MSRNCATAGSAYSMPCTVSLQAASATSAASVINRRFIVLLPGSRPLLRRDDAPDLGMRRADLGGRERRLARVDRDEDGPPLRWIGDHEIVHRVVAARARLVADLPAGRYARAHAVEPGA